jgi:osmotically-inducible protein OsmY
MSNEETYSAMPLMRRIQDTRVSTRPRSPWRGAVMAAGGAAIGAIAAFLADPVRGRARRAQLTDQAAAALRRTMRGVEGAVRTGRSMVEGKLEAMTEGGSRLGPTDDITIRDRAESELFRDPAVPKGAINLNVERGILVLRGEVPDEAMRTRLGEMAEGIEGVWGVRNLLHLPGEPAEEMSAVSMS